MARQPLLSSHGDSGSTGRPAVHLVPRVYQTIVWSVSRLKCAPIECQEENGRLFEATRNAYLRPVFQPQTPYTIRDMSLVLWCRPGMADWNNFGPVLR